MGGHKELNTTKRLSLSVIIHIYMMGGEDVTIYIHSCLVAKLCLALCNSMDYIAHSVPLFLGFFRQKYWRGLLFPSPGHILDLGIEPTSPESPALAGNRKHSSAGGHFFCYHIWAVVNTTAMNTEVCANTITLWGMEVRMLMWVQPMTPRVLFKLGFLERSPLAWAPLCVAPAPS